MKKIGEKILSGAIAFIITFSNFGFLGNGLMEVIAEDTVKEEKQSKIQMNFAISKYFQYGKMGKRDCTSRWAYITRRIKHWYRRK